MFISQNPILVTVALVSSPPRPPLRVNQLLTQCSCGFVIIHHYLCLFIVANSADPDETPRFVASHLGLRCLQMLLFGAIYTIAYFEFQANYASASRFLVHNEVCVSVCVCVRACVRAHILVS